MYVLFLNWKQRDPQFWPVKRLLYPWYKVLGRFVLPYCRRVNPPRNLVERRGSQWVRRPSMHARRLTRSIRLNNDAVRPAARIISLGGYWDYALSRPQNSQICPRLRQMLVARHSNFRSALSRTAEFIGQGRQPKITPRSCVYKKCNCDVYPSPN